MKTKTKKQKPNRRMNLVAIRASRTLRALARQADVSVTTVYRAERGHTFWPRTAIKLARFYGLDVGEFLRK